MLRWQGATLLVDAMPRIRVRANGGMSHHDVQFADYSTKEGPGDFFSHSGLIARANLRAG